MNQQELLLAPSLDDISWDYLLKKINYSSEGSFRINELSSQLEKISLVGKQPRCIYDAKYCRDGLVGGELMKVFIESIRLNYAGSINERLFLTLSLNY